MAARAVKGWRLYDLDDALEMFRQSADVAPWL
jgi:hypothetical protein